MKIFARILMIQMFQRRFLVISLITKMNWKFGLFLLENHHWRNSGQIKPQCTMYNAKNCGAFRSIRIGKTFCTYTLTHPRTSSQSHPHTIHFVEFCCFSFIFDCCCEWMVLAIYQLFLDFHKFRTNCKHIHATTFSRRIHCFGWNDFLIFIRNGVNSKINTQHGKFRRSTNRRKLNSLPLI